MARKCVNVQSQTPYLNGLNASQAPVKFEEWGELCGQKPPPKTLRKLR